MGDSDDRGTALANRMTSPNDRATVGKANERSAKPAKPSIDKKPAKPSPPPPPPSHEVNAVGDYFGARGERSFWANRPEKEKFEASLPREERRRLGKDGTREWFPDTQDFLKVEM